MYSLQGSLERPGKCNSIPYYGPALLLCTTARHCRQMAVPHWRRLKNCTHNCLCFCALDAGTNFNIFHHLFDHALHGHRIVNLLHLNIKSVVCRLVLTIFGIFAFFVMHSESGKKRACKNLYKGKEFA